MTSSLSLSRAHWGQMDEASSSCPRLTPAEREALCRHLPLRPLPLEGPRLYQAQVPRVTATPNNTDKKSLIHNGIRLQEYLRSTEDHLRLDAASSTSTSPHLPKLSPLPLQGQAAPDPQQNLFARHTFQLDDDADASRSLQRAPDPAHLWLSPRAARAALYRSVGETCAFVGFPRATSQALHLLTDVLADYLSRLGRRLAEAHEEELLNGPSGFPDIVERVLVEFGLGSTLSLPRFFEREVAGVHQHLVGLAARSSSAVSQMDGSGGAAAGGGAATPIFLMNSIEDIPEIHFPSSEEGDMDPNTTPQLETGLQMLQSLEQQQGSLGSQGGAGGGGGSANTTANAPAEELQQPMSQDSNASLLLATVSPAEPAAKKRRKTGMDRNS